jgi:CHASE2 domain-containing sensor protein
MLKSGKFWRDSVIGTVFIFSFMWFAAQFLSIFNFLDPVGDALEDMEITDQVFSQLREEPPFEERLVIVNFGRLDRAGIAEQINIINKYKPRVIGIDTFFGTEKDSLGDAILEDALSKVENLVLGTKYIHPGDSDDPYWYGMEHSHPRFARHAVEAHVNLSAEIAGTTQEEFKTVRQFFPALSFRDTLTEEINTQMAFGIKLAEYLDPEAAKEMIDRPHEEELINYRGNMLNLARMEARPKFMALDWMDVFTENFTEELIKDKIVIFGHLGENFGERYWIEDKFFTPMNPKYAGRADLDMYGAVIHANIVSMVLNRDYLDKMTEFQAIMIAIILCFLNVAVFTLIYRKMPLWYDGLTKVIQLVEVMILMAIIVGVFNWYNTRIDLFLAIVVVLLAGDALEVLYGVGYNIFDKKKREKLFTIREQ